MISFTSTTTITAISLWILCSSIIILQGCVVVMSFSYNPNHVRSSMSSLHMVLQEPSISSSSSSGGSSQGETEKAVVEWDSKYPTRRGSTVDSRKIIAVGAGKQYLSNIRLGHILFASRDLAESSLAAIRDTKISFEDMAQSISRCPHTRDKGGEIGWVKVFHESQQEQQQQEQKTLTITTDDGETIKTNSNEHLDLILPQEARTQVSQITTKPGDIIMVESQLGYHLVQILDIMVDVQKMATIRQRRRNRKRTKNQQQQQQSSVEEEDDDDTFNSQDYYSNKTYKMETMGCQMNMADSERMEGQLQGLGMRPYVEEEPAQQQQKNSNNHNKRNNNKNKNKKNKQQPDVVVLNTCSIRDHAEQKVYSYLGPYAKAKRENHDDVTIIVAGCVAQQEGEKLLTRVPEIDLVMGPQYANRMGDLLEDIHINNNQVVATDAIHIMEDISKPRRQSQTCAWINIIYGCNERCTFCIVPTTRGVEQSRPVQSIYDEVKDLVEHHGYKEITLLGQNIDAYGRDMIPKRKFSDLIRQIGNNSTSSEKNNDNDDDVSSSSSSSPLPGIPGLKRLRFVTSHPRYMSLGVVDAVAETPTACETFHIPFQSGSNVILSQMGRGHTREKYLHIVNRIRQRIPEASITADVIIGFPGETEEQFQETLDLMKEVVFDSVNTAAYSPRPNTPAATFGNQIAGDVKQGRLLRINELNKQHALQRRQRMLNQVVEILVEEPNKRNPNQIMGRTRHNYIVYADGDIDQLRGELVNVKIDQCSTFSLAGTIVP